MIYTCFNYFVFLFGLFFGVIFYEVIAVSFHFTYIDEILGKELITIYNPFQKE